MPESAKQEKWRYEDPHPEDRGILLADRIDEFCKENLLISEDYTPKNLRPASYTLRIGDQYMDSEGDLQRLSEKDESFVFKKNSIIFVSTKESLDLPFYVVARFNLRVTWVYDGVLLGTGPQVDPGFRGQLSCPLYNLTNLDITIKRGDDFATIDFEKTTSLLEKKSLEEKKEIIAKAEDKKTYEIDGREHSFYKVRKMLPLQHRKSHRLVSSLFEMKEELRTWRQLGIGSVIAFFGLTLSLLGFGANLYRQNTDLNRQLIESKQEIEDVRERLKNLEATVQRQAGGVQSNLPSPQVPKEPGGPKKEKNP
jgi:deoxycytidine triphosphate deaminase